MAGRLSASAAGWALVLLTAAGAVALTAEPALACSCAGRDDKAHAKAADAIFVGRAVDARVPGKGLSTADPIIYTFAVSHVYKGHPSPRQEVVSALGDASCGLSIAPGMNHLVFATKTGLFRSAKAEPNQVFAYLCGGTRPVATAAGVPGLGVGRPVSTSSPTPTTTPSSEPAVTPGEATAPAGVAAPSADDPSGFPGGWLDLAGITAGAVAALSLLSRWRRPRRR